MRLTDKAGNIFMVHFFHTAAEATDHKGLRKSLLFLRDTLKAVPPHSLGRKSNKSMVQRIDEKLQQRKTICTFHAGVCTAREKNGPCLTPGAAVTETTQSLVDPQNTATGRKISLARAMKHAGISPRIRKELWESYHQKCPPTTRPKTFYGRDVIAVRDLAKSYINSNNPEPRLAEYAHRIVSKYREK